MGLTQFKREDRLQNFRYARNLSTQSLTVLEKLWHLGHATRSPCSINDGASCGCGRSPPARQPREWPAPIYSNQRYRRRRRRQYRDCSDIWCLSVIGRRLDWCLKEIEKRSAGIGDLPSRIVPQNKRLTENIEVWGARG